jgi:hypothetical protein
MDQARAEAPGPVVPAETWGEEWAKGWDEGEDKVADEAAAVWAGDAAAVGVWAASSTKLPSRGWD